MFSVLSQDAEVWEGSEDDYWAQKNPLMMVAPSYGSSRTNEDWWQEFHHFCLQGIRWYGNIYQSHPHH